MMKEDNTMILNHEHFINGSATTTLHFFKNVQVTSKK